MKNGPGNNLSYEKLEARIQKARQERAEYVSQLFSDHLPDWRLRVQETLKPGRSGEEAAASPVAPTRKSTA